MSPNAPAGNASISVGTIAAVCTNATNMAAFGSPTSSHCAPTVCIQVPIMLASCAIHSARNARTRNGAQADTPTAAAPLAIPESSPDHVRAAAADARNTASSPTPATTNNHGSCAGVPAAPRTGSAGSTKPASAAAATAGSHRP